MKPNKSIDGLITRDSKSSRKISAPTKTTNKTLKKNEPTKTAKPIKVVATEPPKEEIVPDESLEIKITDDATTSIVTPPIQPSDDFLSPVQAFDDTANFTNEAKDKKSNKKSKKDKEDKKEKKKPSKARKIITTIILIIVLIIIGIVIWVIIWGNDIIAKITGGQGNVFDLLTFVDDTYEPLKTDANGRTNILAFGTSGYNMQGDEGEGVHAGAALTDSIMMISLNQETGDIAMLSLPRDLKASPTCTATGKINEVYWCNNINDDDEAAGASALMAEVGSVLGVDFQYYAHLNWGSLVYIVDILDGIEVTLDEDIFDYGWTDAVYEAGVTYTINGEEALGLARARHGTYGGDFSRGASQQKILIGIKDKLLEKDLPLTDLIGLASSLGDNLRTNFSVSELKSLAHLTWEFDFDSMRTLSLYPDYMTTGTLDNGISYVFPRAGVGNYGSIQEYVATQLSNDPRVYEEPSILVLNASDVAGLASKEKNKLVEEGYNYVYTDNAPEGEYPTDYSIYMVNSKPGTANLLEKLYNLEIKTTTPETLPQDYDFIIIINPEIEEETEAETEE
ncbi:LCP family protein [Candidatus Saccharibacteria bacterium]|nr:LCP family protein [Candidatus Saccharibacteria bacterium]